MGLRELGDKCFEGEVKVPKTELWLALAASFLTGILYGLKKAPKAHGVMAGSNSGNSFGCCTARKGAGKSGNAQGPGNGGEVGHKCYKKGRCCGKGKRRCGRDRKTA